MKLSIFSLKTEIFLEFLRLGSKSLHSIIADSRSIWCTFYRNEIKKVFWMLIFENFIKEKKFSVPTTKLKGLFSGSDRV